MNFSSNGTNTPAYNFTTTATAYPYSQPFNNIDVILFTVFIFIFLVFGFFANVLTIAVIATSQRLQSIFNYFILSLCVSDTISALISWINLHRRTWGFDNYVFPDFICVLYWGADIWTSYVTALHILSFAILRLLFLRWPHKVNHIKSGKPYGVIWIIVIWAVAFFCGGLPMGLFSGARPKDRSARTPDSKWPTCTQLSEWLTTYGIYTNIAYPIFFYVPILCTLMVSISIGIIMVRSGKMISSHVSDASARARRLKEKQAIVQLSLIVTSFLIGYLPFTAFEFHTFQQSNGTPEELWFDWHFGTTQYMCLRFSECLNPILYNVGSRKLWKETKMFLTRHCGCGTTIKRQASSSVATNDISTYV